MVLYIVYVVWSYCVDVLCMCAFVDALTCDVVAVCVCICVELCICIFVELLSCCVV